jgi:hypothetical protein
MFVATKIFPMKKIHLFTVDRMDMQRHLRAYQMCKTQQENGLKYFFEYRNRELWLVCKENLDENFIATCCFYAGIYFNDKG